MESLLFALSAVLPIVLMIAIGFLLKKAGFIRPDFVKAGNKLVFRVFLPAMLFLNVYKIDSIGGMDFGYILYAVIAQILIFFIGLPIVIAATDKPERRGVLLQGIFRSNYALIGIPLAEALFGSEGVIIASLLSAAVIPVFNILAVVSLSVFRRNGGEKPSIKSILLDIVRNPLIQGIAVGVLVLGLRAVFVHVGISFRLSQIAPLFKVLEYLSAMATPLALLVLGAQFEFAAIKALRREILVGVFMRNVFVPALGIGVAYLFFASQFNGAHFASFVAMFATPVAVSSVPMAQEMDGDLTLAGQLVVWTTLISGFSVFVVAFLLKAAGIFG